MSKTKWTIDYRPLDTVKPDPDQPRKDFSSPDAVKSLRELANSIRAVGLLNPVVIRPDGTIIAGDRRWRAHYILARQDHLPEFEEVPCIVREDLAHALDTADGRAKLSSAQIVENLQRRDLSDLEIGAAILRLNTQDGMSMRDIAKLLGKSPSYANSKKAFFEIASHGDPIWRDAISTGRVGSSQAMEELRAVDKTVQQVILDSDINPISTAVCRAAKVLQPDFLAGTIDAETLIEFLKGNASAMRKVQASPNITTEQYNRTGEELLKLLGLKITDLTGEGIPEKVADLYAFDPTEDRRSLSAGQKEVPQSLMMDARLGGDLSAKSTISEPLAAIDVKPTTVQRSGALAGALARDSSTTRALTRATARILLEIDAELVKQFLLATGHKDIPEDRLELSEALRDYIAATVRVAAH